MKSIRADPRGFSTLELLVAMLVVIVLALVTAPPLVEVVRNSRLTGAARQIAVDVRQARSQAVGTGWQYRLIGFSAGASDSRRNHYRVMSRTSAAVAWPSISVAPSVGSTLVVGDWVDVGALFHGIEINPDDSGQFALTFGTRGNPTEVSLNFSPLRITGEVGRKSVRVSTLGSVRVE